MIILSLGMESRGNEGEKRMKRTALLTAAVAVPVLGLAIGACSSSTSAATTTHGTEHIYGKVTGAAALANNTVIPVTWTGPVNTTGSFSTGGGNGPKKGQMHTFKTAAGNFVVQVSGTPTNTQKLLSASTCAFEFGTAVPYSVVGGKSTGKFADATGSGTVNVTFQGDLPKLANGHCNESNSATPSAASASGTFSGGGPLTVKKS